MELEIYNLLAIHYHLVSGVKLWIIFVQLWPFKGIMAIRVGNNSQCYNWELTEAICNMIGVSLFVFIVQVEFLSICRPLMMVIILQLPLCLYKLKRLVICVDDHLLPKNVMLPLSTSLHDRIHHTKVAQVA